jgi:hypothetical protein
MNTVCKLALAVFLLIMGFAAAPAAQAQALPHGIYRGSFIENGRPMSVMLTIGKPGKGGSATFSIRFEAPWRCGFDVQYAGTQGQTIIYFITSPGEGPCEPLTEGRLQLVPSGKAYVAALIDRAHKVKIRGTLQVATV